MWDYRDLAKFTLALAWRPNPLIAIGFNYSHLWSDKPPIQSGVDTMDLAIAMKPLPWLAAGLVVHDVPGPALDFGAPVQRVWEPEIAVRLFRGKLELAAGARFGERRGDVDPRFRLWVRPVDGVWLKTDLIWKPDVDLDGDREHDIRVAIGLQLDLERVGLSAFGLFGTDSEKSNWHGWSLAARVSGERYPAIWRGPAYLEKINLGPGAGSQRKLMALLMRLRKLEKDRRAVGVMVVIGDLDGSWGAAEEIRAGLLRLRHARKHVYVFLTECNTRSYYVASAGERIFQDPAGGIRPRRTEFVGLLLQRHRQSPRRAGRLRQDRRVQGRSRAVHALGLVGAGATAARGHGRGRLPEPGERHRRHAPRRRRPGQGVDRRSVVVVVQAARHSAPIHNPRALTSRP